MATPIWNFQENEAIETDKVELKTFKPTGKFFTDVQFLVKLFNIHMHPCLKESAYKPKGNSLLEDKDVTILNFFKYRLDSNTLRVIQLTLPAQSLIQTIKFSNNGLTYHQIQTLVTILAADNCPIQNLFIDWNPIYSDSFRGGEVPEGTNNLWKPAEGDNKLSPFAQLVQDAKKLQVLFLRHSGLTDRDLQQICFLLKAEAGPQMNKTLKVLDLSYNQFSGKVISQEFTSVFETNRTLEYVGLAKNNLETADIVPIIKSFGRHPFPTDQVQAYTAKLKERDAIIEKNKKLKASKKPEEPVPVMDLIEQRNQKDQDGNEVAVWYMLKNPQFRHLNICLNNVEDSAQEEIEAALRATPDDFCFTLSGNPFSEEVVAAIQKTVQQIHKQRVTEQRLSEPGAQVSEILDIA